MTIPTPTRVAVTGGAGFVGLNIVEALLGAGHHVVVLDRAVDAHAQTVFEAAIDRARQDLGFAPRYDIQNGIAAYVAHLRGAQSDSRA